MEPSTGLERTSNICAGGVARPCGWGTGECGESRTCAESQYTVAGRSDEQEHRTCKRLTLLLIVGAVARIGRIGKQRLQKLASVFKVHGGNLHQALRRF